MVGCRLFYSHDACTGLQRLNARAAHYKRLCRRAFAYLPLQDGYHMAGTLVAATISQDAGRLHCVVQAWGRHRALLDLALENLSRIFHYYWDLAGLQRRPNEFTFYQQIIVHASTLDQSVLMQW